jgi:hypothetical protein
MTTPAGESVSGAKSPRFTRENVERAVESLKERIKQLNKDAKAAFRITDARKRTSAPLALVRSLPQKKLLRTR